MTLSQREARQIAIRVTEFSAVDNLEAAEQLIASLDSPEERTDAINALVMLSGELALALCNRDRNTLKRVLDKLAFAAEDDEPA